MKRVLIPGFLFLSVILHAQVISYPKTLPVRAFSVGLAGSYNVDNFQYTPNEPLSYQAYVGYGINYSLDVNARYAVYNGPDYIGIDMQYLLKEARQSYFVIAGGLHKWVDFGVDMTGSFTYTPQFWLNLSTGLDIDVDFGDELDVRAWIPLSVGLNITERVFAFVEYDLRMTEASWDIFAGGINFIIR